MDRLLPRIAQGALHPKESFNMWRIYRRILRERRPARRHTVAQRLRVVADRIDHRGAPKMLGWSFTFEDGRVVFHDHTVGDRRGCQLWYYGDDEYERAAMDEGASYMPARAIDVQPKLSVWTRLVHWLWKRYDHD